MHANKKMLTLMAVVMTACLVSNEARAAGDPALSKQRYEAVVSHLDTGGDLLVVANLEGYLQSMVSNISLLVSAIPPSGPGPGMQSTFARIPGFLDRNGFYAVQGFGASVVPRTDGLNTLKIFLARDPAASQLPLWRGLVGGDPRELRATRFLPPDTVFVRTGTGEWPQFWNMVRAGVTEFATPEGAAGFNRALSNLATNSGVDLDQMFKSLGGEGFLSVQFSSTATIEIPSGSAGAPIKFPSPSLLIGVAIKDDTLAKTIEVSLARKQMPILKTQAGTSAVNTLNIPLPLPVPLQPSYSIHSGYFLLGSTPEVVSEAIKAFDGGSGLVVSPEFKKAFQGQPTANNGISYMSPRFMKTLVELQSRAMSQSGQDQTEAFALMRQMLGGETDLQSALVIQNLPDGILMSGTSSSGGKEIMGSVMIAPLGLVAAIAIPSFVKARSVSRSNACINNLRQIDAAKEQWAMAKGKVDGDEVNMLGILDYIKGVRLPVCPQGGTYKINRIGQPPECSIPGHALR